MTAAEPAERELSFATATDAGGVFASLSADFTVHASEARVARWIWLDTPDGRLRRNGMALREVRRAQHRELVLEQAGVSYGGSCGRAHWPCRVEALPPSEVRRRIADTVGARAIVPLAEVEVRSIPLRLLDGLDKTRVTGELAQYRLLAPRRAPLPLRLRLAPLRGYGADADRAEEALRQALPVDDTGRSARDDAAQTAGVRTGRPSDRPAVTVTPEDAAGRAVAAVLLQHLITLSANRDAAAAGIDGEALHDLRVAVRATRAALRLVGDVLPTDLTSRFGDDFQWLGRISSRPRDLDICLAAVDGGLGPATDDLELRAVREPLLRRRRAAFGRFASALHSPRADQLLASWRDVLEQIVEADPPGPTVRDVVGPRTRAALRGVLKAAEQAAGTAGSLATAGDEDLHAVRRRGKELRYLLEGARPLCAPTAYERVHADVRQLVAALGGVQDARVVTAELRDVARHQLRHHGGRGSSRQVEALLASGALIERLADVRRAERERAQAAYERLARPGSARRVARLLEPEPAP